MYSLPQPKFRESCWCYDNISKRSQNREHPSLTPHHPRHYTLPIFHFNYYNTIYSLRVYVILFYKQMSNYFIFF